MNASQALAILETKQLDNEAVAAVQILARVVLEARRTLDSATPEWGASGWKITGSRYQFLSASLRGEAK